MAYDFVNARRIVNGTDKASTFAGYAKEWLAKIPKLVNYAPPAYYLGGIYQDPDRLRQLPAGMGTIKPPTGFGQLGQFTATTGFSQTDQTVPYRLPVPSHNAPMGQGGRPHMPNYSALHGNQQYALAGWIVANFAFLDVIAKACGTYDLGVKAWSYIEGGGSFTDQSKHPGGGKRAGKYLIDESTWQKIKASNTTIKDFTDDSQTATAISILKEKGDYLNDLKADKIDAIYEYAKAYWPEMPGGTRQKITMAEAKAFYQKRYKEIKDAADSSQTPAPSPSPSPSPSPAVPVPSPSPSPSLVDPVPGQGLPGRDLDKATLQKYLDPGIIRIQPMENPEDRENGATGFIVDPSGIVVSNAHVKRHTETGGYITLRDGTTGTLEWLHFDKALDIALGKLKVSGRTTFPCCYVSKTFDARVGDYCASIGNSKAKADRGGQPWDFSEGKVEELSINNVLSPGGDDGPPPGDTSHYGKFMNYKAPGNAPTHGDSGGPVFNKKGVVIALFHAMQENGSGESYALRCDAVRAYYQQKMGKPIQDPKIGQVSGGQGGGTTPPVIRDPKPGEGIPDKVFTTADIEKYIHPGVIMVYIGGGGGTGMIVESNGIFLTNYHMVSTDSGGEDQQKRIKFKDGKTGNYKLLHRDKGKDIAICQIEGGGTFIPVPISKDASPIVKGAKVWCSGMSDGENKGWDIETGTILNVSERCGAGDLGGTAKCMRGSAGLGGPGDSGGPVISERGLVIAMVHGEAPASSAYADSDKQGNYIRVDELRDFYKAKMGRDLPIPMIGQITEGGGVAPPESAPGNPNFTGNGSPINIALGFWDSSDVDIFDFYYTGIEVSLQGLPMVTISGRSVQWNKTRGTVTKSYSGASLFDIAQAIAADNNTPLEVYGNVNPSVAYAVQNESDRIFLSRIARENGYRMRESNGAIVLAPQAYAEDSAFILTRGMTGGLNFSDSADSNRVILRDSFETLGEPRAKATIDLATGRIEYPDSIESVLPSTTIPPDGTKIGRGYPASTTTPMSQRTLKLLPGQLIWIDYSIAPNPFARDWRVDRVYHRIDIQGAITELGLYVPVWIRETLAQNPGTSPSPSPSPSPDGGGGNSGGNVSGEKLTKDQIFERYAEAVLYLKGEQGIGTGFIVTQQGHFLTCNHVLANSGTVTYKDGTTAEFEILGTNKSKDMTVGKIKNYSKGKTVFCAEKADPEAPNGSTLTAIGHPLDKKWTTTSAKRTGTNNCVSWAGNSEIDCIKAESTLVDSGNSGGPIFSERGIVVGMAESQSSTEDGCTKIEWLRAYFKEVANTDIPIPTIGAQPTPSPSPSPSPSPVTPPPAPSGSINQRIMTAMGELGEFSSANAAGTNGGRLACVWAVNQIISKAGLAKIGSNPLYVPSALDALSGGRGIKIDKASVQAGDIVISRGLQHIGIAISATQVKSNSSSKAKWVWVSDLEFGGTYANSSAEYGGKSYPSSQFWRLTS